MTRQSCRSVWGSPEHYPVRAPNTIHQQAPEQWNHTPQSHGGHNFIMVKPRNKLRAFSKLHSHPVSGILIYLQTKIIENWRNLPKARVVARHLNSWLTKENFCNCLWDVTWKVWGCKHNPWEVFNAPADTGANTTQGRGDGFMEFISRLKQSTSFISTLIFKPWVKALPEA